MKSYLQRLISTASGAESQLQPVVGSVFSTPGPREPMPPLLPKDGETGPQIMRTRGALERDTRMGELRSEQPMEEGENLRVFRERTSHFEPLLVTERIQSSETAATPHGSRPRAAAPLSLPATTTGFEKTDQTRATSPKNAFQAAIPSATIASPVAAIPQEHNRARLSRPTTNSPTARPAISPVDEIQIHIGRIEVTAVPAPAKTLPPKSAYKGPSLQQFLKRPEGSMQ